MRTKIVVVAAVAALAACATASGPGYQAAPDQHSTGYFTSAAENGRHMVAYTGAKGMSREQVSEYALLRAAELTRQSGQEWFAVVSSKTQDVQLVRQQDLKGRGGVFVGGGESAGTGTGAGGTSTPGGVSDSATKGGPSTGGFGGGDVPYQVIERWTPRTVPQAVIVIQMGKGDQAKFAGLERAPQIYSAESVEAEIRGKMKK